MAEGHGAEAVTGSLMHESEPNHGLSSPSLTRPTIRAKALLPKRGDRGIPTTEMEHVGLRLLTRR